MKVYLAKSNKANPNDIIQFNHIIRDYNVIVKEFQGGSYNADKEFDGIEVLFVIGPYNESIQFIGRGLYGQITYCLDRDIPIFLVTKDKFKRIISVKTHNTDDWYVTYGKLKLDKCNSNLTDFLPIKNISRRSVWLNQFI